MMGPAGCDIQQIICMVKKWYSKFKPKCKIETYSHDMTFIGKYSQELVCDDAVGKGLGFNLRLLVSVNQFWKKSSCDNVGGKTTRN